MTFNPANPEEGIYPNLPEPVYRKAPGINQSLLKEMDISAAHYCEAVHSSPKPPTPAQVTGTLTHALVLQKKELFAVIPDDAPKKPSTAQLNAAKPSPETIEAIQWWNRFKMNNAGKEFVSKEEGDRLYAIQHAVLIDPMASQILAQATDFEVAAFKKHSSTGLMMKGLADCIAVDDRQMTTVPDLKTCQHGGASESEFMASIFNWGYHRQAAYYLDLFGATYFMFIAVEKEPPYAVACYNLDRAAIELGRRANERDLERVMQCEKSGIWPAYHRGIKTISIPEWAMKRELMNLPAL